jgi:hypothetical protein
MTQQLECLALVAGVQAYHEFITGSPCTVLTDHLSLKFWQSMKYKHGRMGRWSLFLSNYDLTIEYKPGKENADADALSRLPYPPNDNPQGYDNALDNDVDFLYTLQPMNERETNVKAQMRNFVNEPPLQQRVAPVSSTRTISAIGPSLTRDTEHTNAKLAFIR